MTNPSNWIDAAIDQQKPGHTLDQAFYINEEIFDRDMRDVISKQWLLADHVSRLQQSGEYFLFKVAGEEIIVIRDREDRIHAFYNVCRHRGSRICLENEGRAKNALVCPYHAWSFNFDGSLKAARLMPEDFDPSTSGLHKCHIRIYEGLIFLCLTEGTPPDFEKAYKELTPFVKLHGLKHAKIAARRSYPMKANWKLVCENFFECYHCTPSHPELMSVHSRNKFLAFGAGPGSGSQEAVEAYERTLKTWEKKAQSLGHLTGIVSSDENSPHLHAAMRAPINEMRPELVSETITGGPAAPLMGDFKEYDAGHTAVIFNPFGTLLMSNDYAVIFRFTPLGTEKTEAELIWLVHEDAEEGVDFNRDDLIWLWNETTIQDGKITEDNQAGVRSIRYSPGPYAAMEAGIDRLKNWYLNQLKQVR